MTRGGHRTAGPGGAAVRALAAVALATASTLTLAGCGERAGAPPADSDPAKDHLRVLGIHHAHMNTLDVDAAIQWYETVWPTGARGEIAGSPAFLAEMPLLFNQVTDPPLGAFDRELRRALPQSPIWHIGAFVNTTGRFSELAGQGVEVLDLHTGPNDEPRVSRSGLAPYSGIITAEDLDSLESADPREGGFGYILGPDGVLFELTGGSNTTPSLSHVHLFHEQPRCAANWYVDALGMTLPPQQHPDTGEAVERLRWEGCDQTELGPPGWPSLEAIGTLRSPNARVLFEGGSFSAYPRQCHSGRCGADQPLSTSRGQVVDHLAFSVASLDEWPGHLENLGVNVLEPVGRFGTGRAMLIEGPDGLVFELVEGN